MLAYLSGTVLAKREKALIIEVNNVGYLVNVTSNLLMEAEKGDPLELYLHTNVREDEISLYGLPTLNELTFFKQLISVSGVGPRIAIEIFSSPIDVIKNAIFKSDLAFLTQIRGIGKKTAERLIVELKDKVEPVELDREAQRLVAPEFDPDVVEALRSLGYPVTHIKRVLAKIDPGVQGTEEIIRYFLRNV